MHVLLLTSIFPPDIGANAKRMMHLAENLCERGHQVTVVTGFPHYPTGIISPEYRKRLWVREMQNGYVVARTYIYASPERTFMRRVANFGSFTASSVLAMIVLRQVDIIITICPPLLSGLSAALVSRIKQVPFVFDIQDLYPESAIICGYLRNPLLIRFSHLLANFIYKRSAGLVVISEGFQRELEQKGIPMEKIHIVPNWVDLDLFKPGSGSAIRHKYGLQGKLVVAFLGTLGPAQAPLSIVKAADLLRDEDDIQFMFVGHGIEKESMVAYVDEYKLSNVLFVPPQPHNEVPGFVDAADVCLVHLKQSWLYDRVTIPSKTYEYMALGKPIIMAAGGEAARFISEADCGIAIQPEDPEILAQAILQLRDAPQQRQRYGQRGRSLVERSFSRKAVLDEYITLIESLGNSH